MANDRWFLAKFKLDGSEFTHACELRAWHTDGSWHVGVPYNGWPAAHTHANIWCAIGGLFDDNDAECLTLTEIDRAGNRK